ncbi:MAG TPA: hypothetical protein VN193_08630 [Candidatus Angelobacter sp.]|jgi:hypothetical protein|nr:hypothetical protein [Candidatus Angelobacter sp.]
MITPDDITAAAHHSRATLTPLQDSGRWNEQARELDWSCRDTLDHAVAALVFYSGQLALAIPTRNPPLRSNITGVDPSTLLQQLNSAAAILAAVARDAGPQARAYHFTGSADASGFVAMGCAEVMIHTEDIAATIGPGHRAPDDLADRVTRRLFPWAPQHPDPWQRFRWCMGRAALPGHPRQGPDWLWHSAPLDEWDGVPRTDPPSAQRA